MEKIIQISTIVVSILLVIGILLQSRSSGLGGIFGGEGNVFRTKRGIEKGIFITTIVLAVLFLGLTFARLFLFS